MFRRSSRLLSGGYYNSDEESDSSTVTNISYRENIVKVFKKKQPTRKRSYSRTPSNGSTTTIETAADADLVLSPMITESQTSEKAYRSIVATPRPALSTSSSRSQTPSRGYSASREKSSSVTTLLYDEPINKDSTQTSVDSSGYSSCEACELTPLYSESSTYESACGTGAPQARGKLSSILVFLADSAALMVADAHTKFHHMKSLVRTDSQVKKTLLFLFVLLCVCLLLPLFSSFFSHMTVTTIQSQTIPTSQPVIPSSQPIFTPVVDPDMVSAAVEKKMHHLLLELLKKQDQLFSQLQESQQLGLKALREDFDTVNSEDRQHLELQITGLVRQLADYQTDSRSTASSLQRKIQTLEDQNEKLSKEFSYMLSRPSPPPPILNNLTPQLQEAMEKWLTDRIKEHNVISHYHKGGCNECDRPMADKMADFALESQGASVVSTRCSETYNFRTACVTVFGFSLWYPSVSPRTVIQGYPVLLPGKCWAFSGARGSLVISLSHPIEISHVTLDHIPRYNSPTGSIDSAPKDFEVYGMDAEVEDGTLLGKFVYDEHGGSTQTFKTMESNDRVFQFVELRVLSNWGHMRYTCLYRFRVHGKIPT